MSIDTHTVMVEGTITDVPGFEIGVNVNGIVAMVEGNHFVANHVPLYEGENIIFATAVDTFDHMATASIAVTAEPPTDHITVTADPESGVSPMETTLRIEASLSFANSSLTYTGPGIVNIIANPDPSEYRVKMTTPGLYTFTVEVMDDQSNTYTDTVTVLVIHAEILDSTLRETWSKLKTALISGDIHEALKNHHGAFKDRFESIYTLVGVSISDLAQQMQDIELVFAEGSRAKYAIPRNHEIGGQIVTVDYFIYFSKDGTGLWKIERY